jgi:hypothetical protein
VVGARFLLAFFAHVINFLNSSTNIAHRASRNSRWAVGGGLPLHTQEILSGAREGEVVARQAVGQRRGQAAGVGGSERRQQAGRAVGAGEGASSGVRRRRRAATAGGAVERSGPSGWSRSY